MIHDLDEMLSYKVKLMFFRLLGFAILGLLMLFFYGIIKPENPKTRDDEIVKSAETYCLWEEKLEKAQLKIDKCLEGYDLTNVERNHIYNLIEDEISGNGPLSELLKDDNISEIMVNGPKDIYVEIDGKIVKDTSV